MMRSGIGMPHDNLWLIIRADEIAEIKGGVRPFLNKLAWRI
jgi:hypothetical protein